MVEPHETYDCVVVGGGPAGLTAALFAQAKNLRVLVLEGGQAGGQLRTLYPYKPVYNYPGYSRISAGELADRMIEQIQQAGIPVLEHHPVRAIERTPEGYFVISGDGFELRAWTVILASGLGLPEPRKLGVPGEAELEGRGIDYAITDIEAWRGKEVAVFGGGNSAVDNALLLLENQCRVSLVHRSEKLRAEPESVGRIERSGASLFLGWKTLGFEPAEAGKVSFEIERGGERRRLIVDRVLINIGLKPNTDFLDSLDVRKQGKQVAVDTEMRTSVPGIFGCGDAVTYPGKVRLIVTALGEAATAVNSLQEYLKTVKASAEGTLVDED